MAPYIPVLPKAKSTKKKEPLKSIGALSAKKKINSEVHWGFKRKQSMCFKKKRRKGRKNFKYICSVQD